MKKIFALVLAVLTVLGLSSAAFAATVYNASDLAGLLNGGIVISGGNGGYGSLYGTGLENLFGGLVDASGNKIYDSVYTSWFDACPKETCDGTALFYVENGRIKWICTKCDSSGVIGGSGTDSGSGTVHTAVFCKTCGKSDMLVLVNHTVKDGKYYDVYYCSRCDQLTYVENKVPSAGSADYYGLEQTMSCLKGCGKTATLKGYVIKDDQLYAQYECPNHHTFDVRVDNTYYSGGSFYRGYTIQVVSATGGSYYLDNSSARYGDSRTVYFYPAEGYALSSVTVNGVDATVRDNKVTFIVTGDTVVRPSFVKTISYKDFTITAKTNGNGSISASKNNAGLKSAATVTAKNADRVVYNFYPASRNYRVSDVKIDGKSQGAIGSYTFTGLTANHTVEVTFSWINPYCDVEAKYLSAVEYATEAGLMGPYNSVGGKTYFSGRSGITVGDLVFALTELSDTAARLNSDADRIAWAVNYGIISKNTNLNVACDVQRACTLVKLYLEALEDLNKVSFTKLNRWDTVRNNAISLNLATGKTFDGNRTLHRYDLASICRLIARLEYKG